MPATAARIWAAGRPAAAIPFVHLNHTNRLFSDESAARALAAEGFSLAGEGDRFPL